jgi:hypothetical protein
LQTVETRFLAARLEQQHFARLLRVLVLGMSTPACPRRLVEDGRQVVEGVGERGALVWYMESFASASSVDQNGSIR